MRARRPAVLRRLHAIDARRLQERRSWVVSFSILRPFGPRCETAMLRAGALVPREPRLARHDVLLEVVEFAVQPVCDIYRVAISPEMRSKSKTRPPTTSSPGDDARRWREGAAAPRDAAISTLACRQLTHVIVGCVLGSKPMPHSQHRPSSTSSRGMSMVSAMGVDARRWRLGAAAAHRLFVV